MRLLLILTALMLAIAGGIWWKTTRADAGDPNGALQTDPNLGITTFGALPESPAAPPASGAGQPAPAAANASSEKPIPADAVLRNPHERAAGSDPKEPQTAANEIKIPAAPPAPGTHQVRSGETLYRIVLNAYGTAPPELIQEVAKANGLKDPSALKVGQKVKLPSIAGWPAPKAP
jgi:LysM repeat protein